MFVEDDSVEFTTKKLYELTKTIDNRGKTPPNDSVETPYPLIEIASLRTDGRIATYRNCSKYVTEETYKSWFRSGLRISTFVIWIIGVDELRYSFIGPSSPRASN